MTSKGMTIDAGGWLRGLGLGQYDAAFRETTLVLPSLTAEDLKDLLIGSCLQTSPEAAGRHSGSVPGQVGMCLRPSWHRRHLQPGVTEATASQASG